ncbi:DUF397 domain-containing protein [Streptomyces sp. P9(2023)]|uniref:DUF397 domain-containing protein n=1 Tax=Streptomyces sp. P9(2023) TaxID=3064394 RepID=UPI0028F41EA3|nr:DUF397 domain-containing protein [Streptomyces sp. P9(2023)]MDT9689248.1 DUF397 domain-containing protein [Streptomyces sp. P9(2023)]
MNNTLGVPSLNLQWFKSSHSNGSGGECVECARSSEAMLVQDSKRPGGPVLTVGRNAWCTFVESVAEALC